VGTAGAEPAGPPPVDIATDRFGPCRSHPNLPIFFRSSYLLLELRLGPARTMGSMPRSTFHASRTERARHRADGPTLTLIQGTAAAPRTTSRVVPRPHPGLEGFTPDGAPASPARLTVLRSEPDASPSCLTSGGSATADSEPATQSGPGPTIDQLAFARALAEYLESTAGEPGEGRRPGARVDGLG